VWSNTGTLLGTVTFSGETASGWQEATFASPVAVTANTTYVASYHTTVGHFSVDRPYFAGTSVDRAPLHAPADGVAGANGVYFAGATSAFPTGTYQASNYWVDVVYVASLGSNAPPTVSLTAPSPATSFTAPAAIALAATASDSDGSVTRVDFYAGATLLGSASAAPYQVTWSNVAAGTYTLTARAIDNAGATTTSTAVMVI